MAASPPRACAQARRASAMPEPRRSCWTKRAAIARARSARSPSEPPPGMPRATPRTPFVPPRASRRGARAHALVLALLSACAVAPGARAQANSGATTAVSPDPAVSRPDFSLVGRVWVDGPTGHVGVGDISLYNATAAPATRLEVDGTATIRGDLVFDDANGANALTVRDAAANALVVKDRDAATPVTYLTVNSDSKRLEMHAPLHFTGDQRLEAQDNAAVGLQITADAGNALLVFDTRDGAENVVSKVPVNVEDATDACATSVDTNCALNASVVTDGGLVVGKKTFMTGTVRVADVTDASTDANGDVFGAVRLAGGLAVEKSAHVKQKLRVLSDEDGTAAGAGALFVAGGAAVNGYAYLGKDASHSVTLNADLTATVDAVSITATADDDAGIALTSSGANGTVTATAKEAVAVAGWSDSATGAGGVTLVAGRTNAGTIKLQQDTSGGIAPSDRIVIASDGSVTVTTKSNGDLTFQSEGSAPRTVSLNARRAETSKTVAITDAAATSATLATVNLESGTACVVLVRAQCAWGDGKPATLSAELHIAHHDGAAPEPDASATPPRAGVRRASAEFGDSTDSAFEILVTPDDSGGAAATKDFVITVFTADAGSGDAPAATNLTAVVVAEGTFVSLS